VGTGSGRLPGIVEQWTATARPGRVEVSRLISTGRLDVVAYWILSANPGRYRIFDALRDGYAIPSWRIAQFYDEIEPRDRFALWVSGDETVRGVYALGVVTERAEYVQRDPDPYWMDPAEANSPMRRVGIHIDENLINSPILKHELSKDPKFADAFILQMPRGRNPFRLTRVEWRAILSHCPARTGIRRHKVGLEQPPLEYEITFEGTVIGRTHRVGEGSRSWWAQPLDARPWERFSNRTQAEEYLVAPHYQPTAPEGFGQAFHRADEAAASAPRNPFIVDPDLVNRGIRWAAPRFPDN
jgi:EVE domain